MSGTVGERFQTNMCLLQNKKNLELCSYGKRDFRYLLEKQQLLLIQTQLYFYCYYHQIPNIPILESCRKKSESIPEQDWKLVPQGSLPASYLYKLKC